MVLLTASVQSFIPGSVADDLVEFLYFMFAVIAPLVDFEAGEADALA